MFKKINGSWLELHHNGLPEGKYFNLATHNFTDEQWKAKVAEMASLKMKYIVLMLVAYTDEDTPCSTFYDSLNYPKSTMLNAKEPIKVILEEAAKQDMKVFISTGFFSPWRQTYQNMISLEVFEKSKVELERIYNLYGHYKSFYGFYFPDETGIDKYFEEEFIDYVNRYSGFVHTLNSNLHTLIAPYGTCRLVADDYYVAQLRRLDVDFVAYQDEVGVKKTNENMTSEFYRKLKIAHDKAKTSKLWADVEVFTFEGDVYKSALLPASIERIKKQLEAVSPYVDEILIFQYQGMFNSEDSKAYCGADGSVELYKDYKKLLEMSEKNEK